MLRINFSQKKLHIFESLLNKFMKAQVIILTLFLGLLSLSGFAKTNNPQESQQKKTVKSKYDYNLFKLFVIESKQPQVDSLTLIDKHSDFKRKQD